MDYLCPDTVKGMVLIMKKLFFLLALSLMLCSPAFAAETELRGVWVSTVYNLDYPSKQGLSAAQLKGEADAIIENAKALGLNAVFLQVRPCADSLFPSEIFPWSQFISGTQGVAPEGGFDVLGYFVKRCHEEELQLHCWLNPYRISKSASASKEEGLSKLADSHPAKAHPEWVVFHSDGGLYFDPGIPAVQELILSGIEEILEKYEVDGIHFDDYFYPSADFADEATVSTYGKDYSSPADFRRAAVTGFVAATQKLVHTYGEDISFGISPFGIWANSSDNPLGSDTRGNQSYYSHYADSYAWVKKGYVDYIAPQLYWHIGASEGEYNELLRWWDGVVEGTGVKLYLGSPAYRMTGAKIDSPWFGVSEIKNQLAFAVQSRNASGVIFFRYGSIIGHRPLYQLLCGTYSPSAHVAAGEPLALTRPSGSVYVDSETVYFTGSSDMAYPLYVNETEITTRSENGYFGYLASLSMGKNIFYFSNGTEERQATLYRQKAMADTRLILSSCYPYGSEYIPVGAAADLKCFAPAGAAVSAVSGGALLPLEWQNGAYRGSGAAEGHVLYTCETNGMVLARISTGKYSEYEGALSASGVVKTELCDVFFAPDPTQGANGFMRAGMTFPIDGITNGYAFAKGIGYILLDDLTIDTENAVKLTSITDISQSHEGRLYCFFFKTGFPSGATCLYDNGRLKLTIAGIKTAFLFESPLFSSVTESTVDGTATYTLTLAPSFALSGYYLESSETGVALCLREKQAGLTSLSGITVLLDPGHGGGAPGAVGVSPTLIEKDTNLQTALALKSELEELGATVYMTRSDDTDVTLRQRLVTAFGLMPDVFISLHSNSTVYSADVSERIGVGLYAKSALPSQMAANIEARLTSGGRLCQAASSSSKLYLCRAEFCQNILIENEYISSPKGFELISSPEARQELCSQLAQALLDSYR